MENIVLTAASFEEMHAEFIRKMDEQPFRDFVTSNTRNDAAYKPYFIEGLFKQHMKDVVSGKIKEERPTFIPKIVLNEEKRFFSNNENTYKTIETVRSQEYYERYEDLKTFKMSIKLKEAHLAKLVLVNNEKIAMDVEEAYRCGLRVNENTEISKANIVFEKTAKEIAKEPSIKKTSSYEERAIEAKKSTKFLGGKALTGTPKQKIWAEQIRSEKIVNLNEEEVEILLNHKLSQKAKFWIENRNQSGRHLAATLIKLREIFAEAQKAEAANDSKQYEIFAKMYNDITSELGF